MNNLHKPSAVTAVETFSLSIIIPAENNDLTNDRKMGGKNPHTKYINTTIDGTHLPLQPARPRTC